MLGTWLLWSAVTAGALIVPALLTVRKVGHHAHRAAPGGLDRHLRLAVATTLVGLGAVLVAAVLGAGPASAAMTAVVLAGCVAVAAPDHSGWAVRGVTVLGLLMALTGSGLLWLAFRAASSGPSLPVLGLEAGLLLASLWGAARLRAPVEGWLAARVSSTDADHLAPGSGSRHRRTAVAVGALLLPAGAVAALTVLAGPEPPPAPQARWGEGAGTDLPTPSGSSPTAATSSAGPGASTPPSVGSVPSGPPGGEPGETGPALEPARDEVSLVTEAAQEPTPQSSPTQPPSTEPSAGESPDPGGFPTLLPLPSPSEESKTPGYAKEKPNRPSDAPSPGGGQG